MKFRMGIGMAAVGLASCIACSAEMSERDEATGVTFEPIIGGVAASMYAEAAYINIDMTASGGYACSGTLIAPRVVLTAGHCVDTHTRFEVHVGSAFQVSSSATTYDWNEHGATTVNPAHHDIGLIFLNTPIALALYPTLSKIAVADGSKAMNVGRVLNGTVQSGAYQAPATISGAAKIGYPFDYTSVDVIQPGDSGGPVFLSGTHTLVAVNSGASTSTQVLARVDLLSDWILAQIGLHSGTAATGSGGASGVGGAGSGGAKAAGGASSAGSDGAKASGGTSGAANSGGAKATGGAAGAATAGAAGATSVACTGTKETEPNDVWASANKLSGASCSALSSATDVDWYAVVAAPGTHTLELSGALDATLAVGVASGVNCITSVASAQRVNLTVSGASQTLCVKASSASKKIQSYRLSFN